MRILVLGGTQFAGRSLVEQAAAAGHAVEEFHRGRTLSARSESPARRHLIGDRDPRVGSGLTALEEAVRGGERWDAALDMCGYMPRVVRASAELLCEAAGRYVFVSSISVFPTDGARGRTEDAEFLPAPPEGVEEVTGETYGGLKRRCELEVREVFGEGRWAVVRPGLIAGPRDPTDRFTYWVRRLGEGGPVLAAEPRGAPVQFIDARDLSAFMLRLIEGGASGDFNATGDVMTMGEMLGRMSGALGAGEADSARLVWAGREWLTERGFEPWKDLPLTVALGSEGFLSFDCSKARAAGLLTRGLEETARETAAWDLERGKPELKAGFSREREAELVRAWEG